MLRSYPGKTKVITEQIQDLLDLCGDVHSPFIEETGWEGATQRRNYQLLKYLLNHQQIETFAEIGVWHGLLAKYLLNTTPCLKHYVGVDPYVPYVEGAGTLGKHGTDFWNELYIQVCETLIDNRLELVRKHSTHAAQQFEDEYFDMVYIDAAHTYPEVKQDIHTWLPKVKSGGFLSGHDYCRKYQNRVVLAVDEAFNGQHYGPVGMVWLWKKP